MLSRITDRVRVLSLKDCGKGEQVLSVVKELGMKVWLGLWVGPDEFVFDEEKEELTRLLEAGMIDSDTVLGISVGSEAIYREDVTVDEALVFMEQVRDILSTYNVNLPVTIVDIAPVYSNSAELRSAVDVIYTNTFPFWEATPIDNAVDELASDIGWLLDLPESQGKPYVLGETGWPSAGFVDGVGVASTDNQRQYFVESFCYMEEQNWDYYWFTGIDNAWRQIQDPSNTIEGNWGFMYANLTLKEHFQGLSFSCGNGIEYSFAEVDWTIPTDITAAPATVDPASCTLHRSCTGLFGMCCPTENGDFLGCCGSSITAAPSVTPGGGGPSPTESPTVTPGGGVPSPTESPTTTTVDSPTEAPVVEEETEDPTASPLDEGATAAPTDSPIVTVPLVPVSAFPPSAPPMTEAPSGARSTARLFGSAFNLWLFLPLLL